MYPKVSLALAALVATSHAANGINQAATQLIQGYEKFKARPYNDGFGYWTVGYGHRCIPNNQQCQDVQWPLSEQAAQQLFARDMQKYTTCLSNALSKCLNDNQYGALVSWTYNVGCGVPGKKGGMAGSDLVKYINAGQDPNTVAAQQLPLWNKAKGKVSQGLVDRRRAEVNLFQRGSSASGNCGQGGGGGGGGGSGGGGGGNSGYSGYSGYSGGSGGSGGSYSDGGYENSPGDYSGYSGGYSNGGSYGGSGGGSYSGGGSGGGGYGGYSGGSGGYSGYYRKADAAQAAAAENPKPTDAATAPTSTSIIEDATLPPPVATGDTSTVLEWTVAAETQPTNVPAKASSSFVA